MFTRWTRAVVHWRWWLVAFWIALAVLGGLGASGLTSALTTSLTVPGTESATADQILVRHFADSVEGAFSVVAPVRGATPAQATTLEEHVHAAVASLRGARLSQERVVAGLLYVRVSTPLDLTRAAAATTTLRAALAREGVADALVSGAPALQHDLAPVLAADLRRGELVALGAATVLLVLVLGLSWALLVPLAVALASTYGALAIIRLLAGHVTMVLYTPNVVELVGLGLAIDYSLFVVHRFRTELGELGGVQRALERCVATAGSTIVVSASAFALAMTALFLVPVPFVRSLSVAGFVVALTSVAAALSLQPALLSLLGRRVLTRAARRPGAPTRDVRVGRFARLARAVIARPILTLVASLGVLALLGCSVLWLQVTPGSLSALPRDLASTRALAIMDQHLGPGVLTPTEIVIDAGAPRGVNAGAFEAARGRLTHALLAQPDVALVAVGNAYPYVDATQRYARVVVVSRQSFASAATRRLIDQLRTRVIPAAHFAPGVSVSVGGAPAQGVDFLNRIYGAFPWVVALALLLAYLVLVRAFRSLVLALVAVVLDLVSVGVAWGVMVAVFRFGVGSTWLHTYRVNQIEGWVPVFVFAVLFGLSMDYEVFIVTRMREAFDNGLDTSRAIVEGLAHTGVVVTSAAAIMVAALAGMIGGHVAGLQELGVGLGFGVAIDATIVRMLVVPSVMTLLGRWNWSLPAWCARALLVDDALANSATSHDSQYRP